MKSYKLSFFLITLLIIACSEEDPVIEYVIVTETVIETNTVEVDPYADSTLEGNITEDKTLDGSKIWLIKGRVSVTDGTTLTIPAGTIIKAASGTGADASTLIVARGGKIIANGTADNPIIMTAAADNIEVGGTYPESGPALNVDTRGLWGGLLILGNSGGDISMDLFITVLKKIKIPYGFP